MTVVVFLLILYEHEEHLQRLVVLQLPEKAPLFLGMCDRTQDVSLQKLHPEQFL